VPPGEALRVVEHALCGVGGGGCVVVGVVEGGGEKEMDEGAG